jgi:cobalt-zinc-cadmium efflux system membrane fusion protein
MTRDSGIEVTTAGEGDITEHLTTYGKIVPDPGHVSHIGARFEGTVTDVKVTIGQWVKKGDLLATVEANQSLSSYPIHAPFDGIITARHANPGELAQKQPLFTVADYSFMWVELKVFPQDMTKVRAGQKVSLILNDKRINTTIDHVVPNDDDHPFILARASIDNPDNRLSAGMMAQGKIIINQQNVPIAVNQSALQTLEGHPVVFVKTTTGFEARQVSLGLKDDQFVEITQGLKAGEQYVIKNSYTLKADLLKSGAKHAH